MLNTRSFSEIFEEVHSAESVAGKDFSSGWESHLDPYGMAQIMAELSAAPVFTARAGRAYAFKKTVTPAVARPAHTLNEEQLQAFSFLSGLASSLQDNFNLASLKSAYRQAVLKTHPDQGGNSESFQTAKKSYHILQALVKN